MNEKNDALKDEVINTKPDAEPKEEDGGETKYFSLKLLAVVVLAFLAALAFRRSVGVVAMFPIALLLCAASAFFDIGTVIKAVIFGITVFTVNTIEDKSTETTIIFSALCLLATLLAGYSFYKIKASKKIGIPIACVSVALCIALSVCFVGNPFAAISANGIIDSYTADNYPNKENAALGSFEFTSIYYDYKTDAYCVDASSTKYPTEPSPISVNGEVLYDSFYHLMESKISTPYVSDMSAVIREGLPDASFSVDFDGFVSFPDQAILSSESGALYNNVRYEITVGGMQSAKDMLEQVTRMVNVIDASGIGYHQLTFKSGIGIWTRRSVTVTTDHIKCHYVPDIDYVSSITTNEFSEYLRASLLDK